MDIEPTLAGMFERHSASGFIALSDQLLKTPVLISIVNNICKRLVDIPTLDDVVRVWSVEYTEAAPMADQPFVSRKLAVVLRVTSRLEG
jgi:hypothetical protein